MLCHISHIYPAGASLYFTVVAPLARAPQISLPLAEVDGAASAQGPGQEMEHASILPKFQRQMYRTDI